MKVLFLLLCLIALPVRAAVIFDGVNDFLICNGAIGSVVPLGNPAQDRSLGFWFKRYNTNSCTLILEQHVSLDNTFIDLRFNNAFTNRFEYSYHRGSDLAYEMWASEPDVGSVSNIWTHLMLVHNHNDSNSVRLYINGAVKTGAWLVGATHGVPTSAYPFRIGSARGTNFFFGEMDEFFFLFNTLLSPGQAQLIYKSRIRGVARFINGLEDNGSSGIPRGRVASNPFDPYPDGGTVGFLRDVGTYCKLRNGGNTNVVLFQPNGSPTSRAGVVASYYPYE